MDRLYFAYGSNMNPAQMRFRCPGSKAVARATLKGYRFAINSRGVATIVESEKSSVSGVLWKISRFDEEVLDCFEGVRSGAYVKRRITLSLGVKRRDALVYVGSDSERGVSARGLSRTDNPGRGVFQTRKGIYFATGKARICLKTS